MIATGLVSVMVAEMEPEPVSAYSQVPLVAPGGGSFSVPATPPWYTNEPASPVSDEAICTGAIPSNDTVVFPARSITRRTPAPPAVRVPATVMSTPVEVQEPTRQVSRLRPQNSSRVMAATSTVAASGPPVTPR